MWSSEEVLPLRTWKLRSEASSQGGNLISIPAIHLYLFIAAFHAAHCENHQTSDVQKFAVTQTQPERSGEQKEREDLLLPAEEAKSSWRSTVFRQSSRHQTDREATSGSHPPQQPKQPPHYINQVSARWREEPLRSDLMQNLRLTGGTVRIEAALKNYIYHKWNSFYVTSHINRLVQSRFRCQWFRTAKLNAV